MWTEITRAKYRRDELPYASATRDAEWAHIAPLLPARRRLGRPREWELREIVDALLYILWTGCPWRGLPREFPPRSTVKGLLSLARRGYLGAGQCRPGGERARRLGRASAPSLAIIDSQSVPTGESGGPRGFDAGKRIKGRKRHIITDTQGFVLALRCTRPTSRTAWRRAVAARVCGAAFPAAPHPGRPRLSRPTAATRGCRLRPVASRSSSARAGVRLPPAAAALGDRTHLRLDRPQPPPRQRLRGNHCQRRRLGLSRPAPPPLPPPRKPLIYNEPFSSNSEERFRRKRVSKDARRRCIPPSLFTVARRNPGPQPLGRWIPLPACTGRRAGFQPRLPLRARKSLKPSRGWPEVSQVARASSSRS